MNKKTAKPNTRKTQAEERRLQILDIALEVFAAKGFAGTSIKDIAGAAGISQGLMYHYFPGKEALLTATIEYHGFLPQLRQILQNNKERPIKEVITGIAENFLTLLDNKNMLFKLLISEIEINQEIRKAWGEICREGSSLMQKYLEVCVEKGELRRHNTEVTARMMLGIIIMYHLTEDVFSSSKISRQEFISEALSNILRGAGGI